MHWGRVVDKVLFSSTLQASSVAYLHFIVLFKLDINCRQGCFWEEGLFVTRKKWRLTLVGYELPLYAMKLFTYMVLFTCVQVNRGIRTLIAHKARPFETDYCSTISPCLSLGWHFVIILRSVRICIERSAGPLLTCFFFKVFTLQARYSF